MKNFLYFLPGISGADHRTLRRLGVGYAFPSRHSVSSAASEGPGGHGVIVATSPHGLAYLKDKQVWQKHPKGFYVGMYSDVVRRPGPLELTLRLAPIDGHPVELGDGERWMIPIIRFVNGNTMLPRVLQYDEFGAARHSVKEEFREVFFFAEKLVSLVLEGKAKEFSADEQMRFAKLCLEVNYCISEVEISMLQLIDSENIGRIADAAVDGPGLRVLLEEFKKKIAAHLVSGPGSKTGESVCADTAPLTQR